MGKLLGRLFQHSFSVAKQVRTDTSIGSSPVSVAFAAVSLARQIFSDLAAQTALVIGAGETIELAARHLRQHGIGRLIVANRTLERAHALAEEFEGYAIGLTEIGTHLPEADIVISSTASPLPILVGHGGKRPQKAQTPAHVHGGHRGAQGHRAGSGGTVRCLSLYGGRPGTGGGGE